MPQVGPGFPSSTNVFIPNFESSGRLTTGYSRNPSKFHLPKYVKYVKSDFTVGVFLKISAQESARVVSQQEYEWPDGQVRPVHTNGLEQFMYQEFRTHRYDYGFAVGWMTRNQAVWPIIEAHAQIHAQKLMTARTIRMLSVLTTTSNWTQAGTRPDSGTATTLDADLSADHTSTATGLTGGFLDQGTGTTPYLKIALDKIATLINRETLGAVEQDVLMAIANPNQFRLYAESAEIHEYIKGSYWAQEEILQGLQPNNRYGLPSSVYGYPFLCENAVKVTSRKLLPPGVGPTKSLAMPDQNLLVMARPGTLEGVYGAPDFSTATIFWFEDEMTLETFDDPKNRLTEGHLVENTSEILTSPLSGFFVTSSTSVAS
jgi:hypothetical protein